MALRPRTQPERTCVACRETQAKRGLVRLVRSTTEGNSRVTVDESGRAHGRGAYLCTRIECWQRALRTGAVARALNVQLTPDDRRTLEDYSQRLVPATP
ncbi:MAG: YlxR family protein [Dehalococcoidia bacterium]|nr:YlxR family protein [Dehalococcoidia bacterium]